MSCVNPMKAYYNTVQKKVKVCDRHTNLVPFIDENGEYHDVITIPCGKCIGCRLDYSREWANRCLMEISTSKFPCWFLTLTYDDDHLPIGDNAFPTLVKEHASAFIKRLRRLYDYNYDHDGVRFFLCGEYGEKYCRPHYHVIVFNMPAPRDLSYVCNTGTGYPCYSSDEISSLWKNGFVMICQATWQTCAYVSRYVTKKHKGKDSFYYKERGILPEFVNMSLKPGIGFQYLDENMDKILEYDTIILSDPEKGKVEFTPPRYFTKMVEENGNIDKLRVFANNRHNRYVRAQLKEEKISRETDYDQDTYFKIKENGLSHRGKMLIRSLEKTL